MGARRTVNRAAEPRRLSAGDREIRLGLWKIHILHHASKHAVWGLWLLEELAEHGHRLSPGTLYPALARMERNGWIAATEATVGPRARRSFRITAEGRRLLRSLMRDVTELYEEVVLEIPEEHVAKKRRTSSPSPRPPRKKPSKTRPS